MNTALYNTTFLLESNIDADIYILNNMPWKGD